MALTLNNLTGFEPQGAEEASATSGTIAYETTNMRNGGSALKLASGSAGTWDLPWVAGDITDAGSAYVFGFGFRKSADPGTNFSAVDIRDDSGGVVCTVGLATSGVLYLANAGGAPLDFAASALSDDTYYYVEVYAELNNGSGDWEWFINGVSENSGSGADFTDGNAFGSASSVLRCTKNTTTVDIYFDDIYILSGATAASDSYGDFAVKAYQNTAEDATDQGDALVDVGAGGTGTWANLSQTPGVSTDDNTAKYEDTGNLAGSTICDEGTRSGPSGDGDVTGTIKGAKWIGNFKRSSGGGRTHEFWVGNDADWITTPTTKTVITLSLTTDYVFTEKLLEASDASVPTASDFFQHGFSKSATAGQDIFCGDIWAMLGYVPSAEEDTSDVEFAATQSLGQQEPVREPNEVIGY